MDFFQLTTIVLGLGLAAGLIYYFWQASRAIRLERLEDRLYQISEGIHQQLHNLTQGIDNRLRESHQRLDATTQVVGRVSEKLVALEAASQRIFEVGKDVAGLQDLLKAPRLRGGFGEYLLEEILSQILPKEHYQFQYAFKSGIRVDAVIRLQDILIPVDSKFPLESFQKLHSTRDPAEKRPFKKAFLRDLKKHVDDVAQKYILPEEGTADFALMYIPAENVYYELVLKETGGLDFSRYAFERRVVPVSPNSFYAYLRAIAMGLRGMKVEKGALEILKALSQLHTEFQKFEKEFRILGKHFNAAAKSYVATEKQFERIGQRLESLEGSEPNKLENRK
jgi:DNA recombination protein RmuC